MTLQTDVQSKGYNPKQVEEKRRALWDKHELNKVEDPLAAEFSIALPPPNVTGELHMGHALNDTLQDILLRYHKMNGKKIHWQIGCDHAGIGTQIVVEKELAKQGLNKHQLGREAFEKKVWEWTDRHLGKIEGQMRLLGLCPDWTKSKFTLDHDYAQAVRKSFYEYFQQGLIYKGKRLVNWCPHCLTSLSDLEVVHEERKGKLYKIKYKLLTPFASLEALEVATSRPETIFADVALAINPNDERFGSIIEAVKSGKLVKVLIPLSKQEIPIILSERVELGFGSGVLKVTPAHDFNDQEIIKEWNSSKYSTEELDGVNIFSDSAELLKLDCVPQQFWGLERFKARDAVLEALAENEQAPEEEKYTQSAALHDRCGNVIEPYLSPQWFVNMKPLAKLAIEALETKKVNFFPQRYAKTYLDWLTQIQDWCISRQLWWGHQIPVWTKKITVDVQDPKEAEEQHKQIAEEIKKILKQAGYSTKLASDKKHSSLVIASKASNEFTFQYADDSAQIVILEPDLELEELLGRAGFIREEDVLDTWFSSALWPFASQGWPSQAKSSPQQTWTSCLITAREIINLWVSRMIFSSVKLTGNLPFSDILIHPVIQTPDGKRMSKSKGNAIDPIALVNSYGADASRLWYSSVGIFSNQDTRFPGKKEKNATGEENWISPALEQNRRFINKLWNATKFVMQQLEKNDLSFGKLFYDSLGVKDLVQELDQNTDAAELWILTKLNDCLERSNQHVQNYRFQEFARGLEDFIWEDFCNWYLELSKQSLGETSTKKRKTLKTLCLVLENVLRAIHPITPFVSEELWQLLCQKDNFLFQQSYPQASQLDSQETSKVDYANKHIVAGQQVLQTVRSVRQNSLGLAPNEFLQIQLSTNVPDWLQEFIPLGRINILQELPPESKSIRVSCALHNIQETVVLNIAIPETVDLNQRMKILENNLEKKQDELSKLTGRVNNQGFMANAPEEVKDELKRNISSAELVIQEIQEAIKQINESMN